MNNPIEQACIGQKIVTSPQYPRDKGEKNFIRGVHSKATTLQYSQEPKLPEYWNKESFITQILGGKSHKPKIINYWEM